jgi:hypothetical protein
MAPLNKIRYVFGISLSQEADILLILLAIAAGYLLVSYIADIFPGSFIPLLAIWLVLSLYLTWRQAKAWMGW